MWLPWNMRVSPLGGGAGASSGGSPGAWRDVSVRNAAEPSKAVAGAAGRDGTASLPGTCSAANPPPPLDGSLRMCCATCASCPGSGSPPRFTGEETQVL